ncbi:1-acyl-sn-glycerol-3-phosphate acyltransferase [Streptomyces sp. B1866]|uniref:1-acyl-sn-glycerol-3-phosphate acyltransferase n=1 Tax=Streptomyces sp. B1866 TaxID=3075431 RepID=UPI0028912536|nr:1-acyl-sn-glycerol-3-phosphate acyltransferase [Streptomyces sp. B1866]MDT3397217.1 1-acyl-sn-glycerol-3-phosphate acyltransferase [Streptomyces sp. B1866]
MNAWAVWSPCTPARCVAHAAARVPAGAALRRSAAFGRAVARAFASGDRIAEPEALRAHARALLDAVGVRLEAAPRAGQDVRPGVWPDVRPGARAQAHPGARPEVRAEAWPAVRADARGGTAPRDPAGRTPAGWAPDGRDSAGPGTLVVANHISWLDIVALLAVEPVTMLAKREVAGWPVVGRLTRRAGTLFIDRDRLRGLPETVAELSARLRAGQSVAVFPQGVTWCSGAAGRFRRAAFQAALDAGAPVRPVTLGYYQHGTASTVAAFVGEDGFASSLRRVLGADGLTVRVTVHEPVLAARGADDRRALAARAQAVVGGARLPVHG